MTKIVPLTNLNLVTPKAGTSPELLFSQPASESTIEILAHQETEASLLDESSCLARALGVTKLATAGAMLRCAA